MQKEIKSLHKDDIWEYVKLHKYKKSIHCKWVFKRKEDTPSVKNPRYKARLLLKGLVRLQGKFYRCVLSNCET